MLYSASETVFREVKELILSGELAGGELVQAPPAVDTELGFRKAEELISSGAVKVNGETAQTGQSVASGDRIEIDIPNRRIHLAVADEVDAVGRHGLKSTLR